VNAPRRSVTRAEAIVQLALDGEMFDWLVAHGDIPQRRDGRFDALEIGWLRDLWSVTTDQEDLMSSLNDAGREPHTADRTGPPTLRILNWLFADCDGYVEIRAVGDERIYRAFAPVDQLATLNAFVQRYRTKDLFFGVATRQSTTDGLRKNCLHLPALFADLDFQHSSEQTVREALARFPLPPGLVIGSGGGLHPYWKLREPIDLRTEDPDSWLRRLAAQLHGDLAAAEAARVMRLPGSRNHKYPSRPRVVVEAWHGEPV
jgi:hypothetical protein